MNILKAVLGDAIDTAADRLIPDINQNQKFKLEMAKAVQEAETAGLLAQTEINKTEASHPSVFVAGWRPACGWICASALGYNFILSPLLAYSVALVSPETSPPPPIELGPLLTVLLGMLGLGGLRTYEKGIGTARSSWGRS